MNSAGGAAAAVAAAQKKIRDEEEERLASYNKEDLAAGWEFKIVRSNTAIKGERFAGLCREEAQNGWELVEKFDNNRFRFKRLIANRTNDNSASIDPYRTRIGLGDWAIVGITLATIPVILIIIFYIISLISS
jgi:hypothetical protein